ncbi:hypothetical protein GCM10009844_06700 [Nocardioides koreensis]|uniref:Peptide zinc metalloprotease protein n=1 Tax=Nocardioides koreensis TaxID=433651 RepID=A0ABP5L3N1_9ACTN
MTTTGGRGELVGPAGFADRAAGRPPARAEGVRLMGEMSGSGYRRPPSLARRGDGQVVQLTPLLYLVLAGLDGERGYDELADEVSRASGRTVSPDNVRQLSDKLRSLGLAASEDGSQPSLKRSNPLLALRFKAVVTDPERTRRLTAPFAALFNPILVAAVLAVFVWISWWVLFERGLASATHDAFARPGLLLVVLTVTVLSAGFHEFGHAAAARRGGATPGAMGVGLYLIWPAFYTDVTDSYRLGRGGRLRTDLGGLYFNALVAVGTAAVWWLTRDDAILLLVATQILQMLHQLLPLVRFDGYHVLADLTGVPDLFQRIRPTLRGLLPWHWRDADARLLKPWARAVVSVWVLTVVPLLAFTLVVLVTTFPRIVGSALTSSRLQWAGLGEALQDGDVLSVAARGVAALVVLLPPLAMAIALSRVVRRVAVSTWTSTRGRPVRRGLALVLAAALGAALVWVWWPSPGRYRPVQAYERGTLTNLGMPLARPAPGFATGTEGRGAVYLPPGQAAPTREHPMLAVVLVPHDPGGTAQPDGAPATGSGPVADGTVSHAGAGTWIFPIDQPLAPEDGDNQALSVNTTDDSVTYDTAFALIWADGDTPVDSTNEAYALASCDNCAAVAVAFQVVLVTGQADVAVPQNVSVALNYDCTSCLTYSLAVQLFVTLDGPLGDDAMAALDKLWQEIAAYGDNIGQVPLDEIQGQLTDFEHQILAIIQADQGSLGVPSGSPSPSDPASTTAPTDPASSTSPLVESPSSSTSIPPSSSPSVAPSGSPSTSSSSTETASPSSSPTGSASPAASPSPSTSPSAAPASTTPTAG